MRRRLPQLERLKHPQNVPRHASLLNREDRRRQSRERAASEKLHHPEERDKGGGEKRDRLGLK